MGVRKGEREEYSGTLALQGSSGDAGDQAMAGGESVCAVGCVPVLYSILVIRPYLLNASSSSRSSASYS